MPDHADPPRILTVEYDRIVRILCTDILLSPAIAEPRTTPARASAFRAIWDTGATHTVISQTVIATLQLFPVAMTDVMTADGERQSYAYLVNVILPNKVIFPALRVIEGKIRGDVLIGMDIISQGDFAVTNACGTTTYSFRVPSIEHIDFGKMTDRAG